MEVKLLATIEDMLNGFKKYQSVIHGLQVRSHDRSYFLFLYLSCQSSGR